MADLTETQLRVLSGIRDHSDPFRGCQGRSAHGGRALALKSVMARGWARWDQAGNVLVLTEAGRSALGGQP